MRPCFVFALSLFALLAPQAQAGSVRLLENAPQQHDFVDIPALPEAFGAGEFTFELWIKPDQRFPVGPTWRASKAQLRHWAEDDPKPYSTPGWWLTGNWLLDGMTRPQGFMPGATREGSFGLQFHGGGRLRWLFADGGEGMPAGGVWAVQAWPASTSPSLLDGRWHHVAAVRRWRAPEGATLELWVDGARVAATGIPHRTDMRRFWRSLPHPQDPPEIGGWALGSEVMTAWDYVFNQYEDYKGLVDELALWTRALSPREIAMRAQGRWPRSSAPVARYRFDEGEGVHAHEAHGRTAPLVLHKARGESWSGENAPSESP